jgi:hypothetical protein
MQDSLRRLVGQVRESTQHIESASVEVAAGNQDLSERTEQAASNLQKLGVISYSRGLIKVLDRPQLETLSCECYAVVKKETDQLLDYMPQRQVITNTDAIPTATL